jgi:hypothetical protein
MSLRGMKLWKAALLAAPTMLLLAGTALAAPATYKGSSSTGDPVFFETEERLVLGDTDAKRDIYVRTFDPDVEGGTYVTRPVSTGPVGGNDAYHALFEGNSPDGSRVFFSTEEQLVGADTDRRSDVYMRNLAGTTTILSLPTSPCSGTCGNSEAAAANFVGAAANGSVVFFATNEQLDGGDHDSAFDVYARDLTANETKLVSTAAAGCIGTCGDGAVPSNFEGSSADGTKVFFTTTESLAAADPDQFQDVYRRDLATGTTVLVSSSGNCPAGLECDAVFRGATPGGAAAFFQTTQPIDAADGDLAADLYAWTGSVVLVSRADAGCGTCVNQSQPATFSVASADGTKVVFQTSEALVAADSDNTTDIYRRDLGAATTALLSPSGTCPLTACIAEFRAASADTGLVFFQTAERLDGADVDSALDIYLRDVDGGTTTLVSAPAASCAGCGDEGAEAKFGALAAGATKVFFSSAEPLATNDEDGAVDVYLRDLGGTPTTSLATPDGVCPLPGDEECDAGFEAVADTGSPLVFSTVERLDVVGNIDDLDSEADVYQRAGGVTRLVSTGNSVELGPSTPILTSTSPTSPNPSLEPWVMGQSDPGTSIKVYSTPDCSGAPVKNGVGTAAELMGSGIRVAVEAGSTTIFRATATDVNGDTSGCSAVGLKYQQADAPVGEELGGEGPAAGSGGTGTAGGGTGSGSKTGGGGSIGKVQPVVPQTRITFGPASRTRARRPVFRFTDATGQGGTEFRCRIDSGRWRGCSSPYRAKLLRPGKHSFSVKGANSGLSEPQPVSRRFKVVTS